VATISFTVPANRPTLLLAQPPDGTLVQNPSTNPAGITLGSSAAVSPATGSVEVLPGASTQWHDTTGLWAYVTQPMPVVVSTDASNVTQGALPAQTVVTQDEWTVSRSYVSGVQFANDTASTPFQLGSVIEAGSFLVEQTDSDMMIGTVNYATLFTFQNAAGTANDVTSLQLYLCRQFDNQLVTVGGSTTTGSNPSWTIQTVNPTSPATTAHSYSQVGTVTLPIGGYQWFISAVYPYTNMFGTGQVSLQKG